MASSAMVLSLALLLVVGNGSGIGDRRSIVDGDKIVEQNGVIVNCYVVGIFIGCWQWEWRWRQEEHHR
jgi:hypothetical protein